MSTTNILKSLFLATTLFCAPGCHKTETQSAPAAASESTSTPAVKPEFGAFLTHFPKATFPTTIELKDLFYDKPEKPALVAAADAHWLEGLTFAEATPFVAEWAAKGLQNAIKPGSVPPGHAEFDPDPALVTFHYGPLLETSSNEALAIVFVFYPGEARCGGTSTALALMARFQDSGKIIESHLLAQDDNFFDYPFSSMTESRITFLSARDGELTTKNLDNTETKDNEEGDTVTVTSTQKNFRWDPATGFALNTKSTNTFVSDYGSTLMQLRSWLPDNYKILLMLESDANGDNQYDYTLVLEPSVQTGDDTKRQFLVLLGQSDGTYKTSLPVEHVFSNASLPCGLLSDVSFDLYGPIDIVYRAGAATDHIDYNLQFTYNSKKNAWLLNQYTAIYGGYKGASAENEYFEKTLATLTATDWPLSLADLDDMKICQQTFQKNWRVTAEKTHFYDDTTGSGKPRAGYVVKGDVVHAFSETSDFVQAFFIPETGPWIKGFLRKADLTAIDLAPSP